MVVLDGDLSVSTQTSTVAAGRGEIIYMPKGEAVTIRSGERGADTAYITYPHWEKARSTAD
jgi:ethanolamine utilization protein EutQ (cupin superfamily)